MLHTVDNRKMLFLPFLMLMLVQYGVAKPLDATARITTLLNENISTSLEEKAAAIDTILRLLAEIDLPAICEAVMIEKPDEVTQMDNIIAAAAKEQGFDSMMPTKLQTTDNMVLPADFPMKKGDILPADFPMKVKDVMKPVRERAATIGNLDTNRTEAPTSQKADPTNNVIIKSVHSLKPNVSLAAEARRLESQELPKLDRPELVGFKLVPSEHYVKEMEGENEKAVGVLGGTAEPVRSMAEGITFQPSTFIPVSTEIKETLEKNATTADVNTPTTQTSSASITTSSSSTTTTSATTTSTTESADPVTPTIYLYSSPSTSQVPEIETTTSNEIIEDISGTSRTNVAAVEAIVEALNVSTTDNITDESTTDEKTVTYTTETPESNTTSTMDMETELNTTFTETNISVSEAVNSDISLYESADDQTTMTLATTDVDNSTEESVEVNTTVVVTTEPTLNTTGQVYTDISNPIGTDTTTNSAATTEEESVSTTATEAATTTTVDRTTTTEAATSSMNTVTKSDDVSSSTTAVTDDLQDINVSESVSDRDTTLQDVPKQDATTLDYFWTPGKTIRMSDSLYDYDDATDDGHTTSFHVSVPSDDVHDVAADATNDTNLMSNETNEITTESTPEVSTESVTAAPGDYDYVYNLVDLTGDHKQETAYHRYDSTGSYGGYDVHNSDYVAEDGTDYILDSLKPSARFIAGDSFSKDHKPHGVNMLASADSPANTAAEQDFMLSAQPGYFNSLADQSSWGIHKLKHNSVSDDKEYNKQFTAHNEDTKDTVTSGLASAVGVHQKTVWSEPTLPQIFFQPNGYACPGLFGYYADISDCQAFFICSWGVPYRFLCPPGTLWSSSETVCDWSSNVHCGKKK